MRFNSVLAAFAFVLLTSAVAALIFVQTKSFGTLLTRVISDISEKKFDTKLSISDLGLSLFPPGLVLNKVSLEKQIDQNTRFQAELGKVGLFFSFIEIEERKLAFGEIKITDSVVEYYTPEKEKTELKELDPKLVDLIFDSFEELPIHIDTFLVETTKIIMNHELVDVRRLKLFKKGKGFVTRFHVANLRPSKDDEFSLDEVWGDADIDRTNIEIQRLKIQHDVQSLLLKGSVQNYPKLKQADFKVYGELQVYLKNLSQIVTLPEIVKLDSGRAHINFKILSNEGELEGESSFKLEGLESNFVHADSILGALSLKKGQLQLLEMDMAHRDETAKLSAPAQIADLEKSKFLQETIKLEVTNFSLSNGLRFLGTTMEPLKAKLSGLLNFNYQDGDLYFRPQNGFIVKDLGLYVGKDKDFKVLLVENAVLKNAEFAVVKKEFQMSALVELKNSKLDVDGYITNKEVRFSVLDASIDLADFGNIANLDIVGAGKLSVEVAGPLDSVELGFKGKMQNFGVIGYHLGTSELDLNISLDDSTVNIRKLESLVGKTNLTGNGVINYSNLDIALGINTSNSSYYDLSRILTPIFSKLDFLPADLEFNAKVDAYIYGKTKLDHLRIKSSIKFEEMVAYGQSLNEGSFNVKLEKEILEFNNFEATKNKGSLMGEFSFNFPQERLKLRFDWDNLALSTFNFGTRLNIDGKLAGSIQGEGKTNDYALSLNSKIYDTKSQNHKFGDSSISLKIMPGRFLGNLDLLGSSISSKFDFFPSSERRSNVFFALDLPDARPILMAFLGQHLENEEFTGRIKFDLDASFLKNGTDLDLSASLKEMIFVHEDFQVHHKSQEPEFVVKNSQIVKWGLNIRQPDLFVATKGSGTFGKALSLENEFHFNSKLLGIFLAPILSSEGIIRNVIKVEGQGHDYQFFVSSQSDNLDLSIEGVPFPINDLKYAVDFSNGRFQIKKLVSSLDSGSVSLKGDVFFGRGEPDINIKYVLDRAEIPILGKSVLNLSGEGIILGNSPPYILSGEVVLNKAQIVNELHEFSSKSMALGQVRFLPKNQESPLAKWLNLNLNVKVDNPIRITNSLMDVGLKGELRLSGSPTRPRGEGRLFSPTNSSRIYFKNNEYLITNADLNFSPKKDVSNPDFDIQAQTFISSYRVTAKAYGDLERFSFDLTSDPALTRNSILSLIAFGYTDEIQSTISEKDQQNLTQVGVGSFVFDRFKISDILNKQFGLQVNLGTVFEQSQTESMLAGRSQEGAGGSLNRTRSATKIELKKRLDEATSLSVSSTMGGNIGQRQSMNLTYNINRKVQLEGVYELRTNDEGEENSTDNSVGGDLKFRWTFK